MRQLDFTVKRLRIPEDDFLGTEASAVRALEGLKRSVGDALHTLRDYELSAVEEDIRLQARILPKAVKSLETLRERLLKASEFNIVGPADVAQISAQLDELVDSLR